MSRALLPPSVHAYASSPPSTTSRRPGAENRSQMATEKVEGGGKRSAESGQVLKVDCVWCRRRAVGLPPRLALASLLASAYVIQ